MLFVNGSLFNSPGRPKKVVAKEPDTEDEMDLSQNSPAVSDMSKEEETEEEEVAPAPVSSWRLHA